MRERKYRLWYKNQMWYPGERPFWISPWGVPVYNDTTLDDAVIMEYTGIVDKNGREIWEGDIVREKIGFGTPKKAPKDKPYVFVNGVVTWHDDGWIISYQKDEYWKTVEGNSIDWYRVHYGWREVEVIGNIYENPDLLEQKKTSMTTGSKGGV